MWAPLGQWALSDAFEPIVDSFRDAGITESTVMWPPDGGLALFERAAATIRQLRQSALPRLSGNSAKRERERRERDSRARVRGATRCDRTQGDQMANGSAGT
jgi:hypothetical protein